MATPQTPLMTSRMAQLFQTPTSVNSGPSRTRVRKFPGPAGVLPKLTKGQKLNDLKAPSPENDHDAPSTSSKPEEFPNSQDTSDTDFFHGAWQTMKIDLDLEEDNPHSILAKNNIASLLRKASLKQLTKNKVPHLCVLIKAITFNTDASVVLRDPTGEMQGTIHRRLVEEHLAELKPGSVLVLRQVGVLSPSLRNHYLNITPSNLIQLYPSESTLSQSSQRTPKSHTPRSSRRASKEAAFAEGEQTTPKRSKSSEVIPRLNSGESQIHDTPSAELLREETPQRSKRSESSELRHRHDSGGRRWDTPCAEAAHAVDNHTALNRSERSGFCTGSRKDILSPEGAAQSSELKRDRRGSGELNNHSSDAVNSSKSHQGPVTKDFRFSQLEQEKGILKDKHVGNTSAVQSGISRVETGSTQASKCSSVARKEGLLPVQHKNQDSVVGQASSKRPHLKTDILITNNNSRPTSVSGINPKSRITGLSPKGQSSNHDGGQKGEDFAELLADIGDDFFEDF